MAKKEASLSTSGVDSECVNVVSTSSISTFSSFMHSDTKPRRWEKL